MKRRIAASEAKARPSRSVARRADSVDRVYAEVQRLAADFLIVPGQRINEVELAQQLSVSRTPVRAALNRLVRDGFMTLRPNRGFFVREIDPDDVRDLYELRAAVERSAVRLACQRASDDEIAAAAAAWDRDAAALSPLDPARATGADEALHMTIARMTGNGHLVATLQGINLLIRYFRRIDIETVPRRLDTFGEHRMILAALAERDAVRAGDLMEKHVTISAEHAIKVTRAGLARLREERVAASGGRNGGSPPAAKATSDE
ncbi:GntR family transcriptional regulator [Enterovirga aerilata]|uniref:GntR family transcriptional regulator n=1 Tax=Enterovirga aerilata TaxID=2730920 RepID=A0A849HZ08_9HYPH|nr:GntR family transcriptional regulator [Enterovirga sp. DB1703]NNM72776.1 GntR family transcriptional regulator [Enterovirga sp. DB1703]